MQGEKKSKTVVTASTGKAGTARGPQMRGVLRARQLLDAAAELFVEKGFEATSIDDIVAAAGTAKGTFYHHFDSKTALLLALRDDIVQRFSDGVIGAVDRSRARHPAHLLRTWVSAALTGYVAMGKLPDIVFVGSHQPLQWTASDEPFSERLVSLLMRGREERVWRARDPHVIATMLFRGLLGVIEDFTIRGVNPATALPSLTAMALAMTEPIDRRQI